MQDSPETPQSATDPLPVFSDIVVIGAGPAGLGFARALCGTGLTVTILERHPEAVLANPPEDGRDIALTQTSEKLMWEYGIWDRLDEAEIGYIRDAKVLNGKSSFALHFDSLENGADYLGRILPNHLIRKASYEATVGQAGFNLVTEADVAKVSANNAGGKVELTDGRVFHAKLVVAADSRFSETRRKMGIGAEMNDFGRTVIVCEVTHEGPHQDVAYECFHYDRTLAILPMPENRSSVVVTLPSHETDAVMQQSEEAFCRDIAARFDNQLGAMTLHSPRHAYPLMGVYAKNFVKPGFALVGDAAVGMHPVTAHGYNLGLVGANTLAVEIRKALEQGRDWADMTVLSAYERTHRRATAPLYYGTNAIVKLFTDTRLPAKVLRGAVLRLGERLPPVKRVIMNQLTQVPKSAG
ncbi:MULTISPECIES: 5-demethoxyubiquinol-8 5-hydroxylase UbiM [Halocynthiibacter]|uniref:5-demethoxyubiquinol-8 5-hydroxylase UbiM n=1 Tax=Halocynthiibacter halioticoli TaxID=2986804 RepID=A0AAE3IXV3_9RHOB|nr:MULTISPECIES: 5-demethoxyubiquinol-8 5-hydroxylase UbiM [Halocynthiibacter]MCV6824257.1 5-demethoxyubiquinol-8 5-hydroxylase UbiM [Halocynthiibacter halioticoli]MCW4057258.1 5-demethoxyubiquinol-8 5-hydroxylase UbiM [Halocynthiibacter sp. SDUM655004]